MGSMKQKRRKKLAKAWREFQANHELTDDEIKFAKSVGYPLDRLLKELATDECRELPIGEALALIHAKHEKKLSERRIAIAEGTLQAKAKKKKLAHDPEWVKAKKLCRLNQDDIRKSKKLGLKPKSLMKNIPSPKQKWKLPVKHWIAELYEEKFGDDTSRAPTLTSSDSDNSSGDIPF